MRKLSTLHPVIKSLLASRGIKTSEEQKEFFSMDLQNLPSHTLLFDLQKAATRIATALRNNESIAIFGDYDVDGTTSCALLYKFFKMCGQEIQVIQPSRFVDGYGIHPSSVQQAKELGVKVLITVDCGITGHEAALEAKKENIELIITDHHKDASDALPEAFAVINPNRKDQEGSPFSSLAGVGVAFFLAVAIREDLKKEEINIPSLYPLLQFVAIGTICDLAPLTPLNRRLVRHGLLQIPKTEFEGLKAFLSYEEKQLSSLPHEKLSFEIGPMINSKGRLEHPDKSYKLLISENADEARLIHSELQCVNRERQQIQREVFEEAKAQVKRKLGDEPLISIAFKEDWHEGVIGIVASKLVEEFKVPAMVFAKSEGDLIKGSARSTGELDLFSLLKEQEDLFERFGGHKKAAGLSMKRMNLGTLENRLESALKKVPPLLRIKSSTFDMKISPSDISAELAKDIELLAPFGVGFDKPLFALDEVRLDSFDLMKDVHVRWLFSDKNHPEKKFKGISFNYIGAFGRVHPADIFKRQENERLQIICNVSINRWKGNEYIQLGVEEICFKL